jgi:hypothetical protein
MAVALMCTEFDLVSLVHQFYDNTQATAAAKWVVKSQAELRRVIAVTDGQIRSALRQPYGSTLTTTPYALPPLDTVPGVATPNTGTGVLADSGITVGASAITELWTVSFSSATAFSVSATISGSQGSGTTGSNFTSTNSYLTIASTGWSGTPANGDKFYITTYNVEAMLVDCSAHLAAADVLRTAYGEWVPNQSALAAEFTAYVWGRKGSNGVPGITGLLEFLKDDRSGVQLSIGMVKRNLNPVQVDHEIDKYGEDVTNYADLEWDSTG